MNKMKFFSHISSRSVLYLVRPNLRLVLTTAITLLNMFRSPEIAFQQSLPPTSPTPITTPTPSSNMLESVPQNPSVELTTWHQDTPTASPSTRAEMGLAYDADRKRLVVFGGFRGSSLLDDTWEYDGNAWASKTTSQTPGARRRPAISYDPIRKVVVLFGGSNLGDSRFYNDTWEYDGSAWVKRTLATSPSLRNGATMIYDPKLQKMLLFGGYYYSGQFNFYNDTWTYDGIRWVQLSPAHAPDIRETATVAYDATRQRVMLFGGGRNAGNTVFNDLWEWDGSDWAKITTQNSPPSRWIHGMAFDQQRNRLVVFGGLSPSVGVRNDTWEYDPATQSWLQMSLQTIPVARLGHSMAYDAANSRVVMFGGVDSRFISYYNDTWAYQGPAPEPQRAVVFLPGYVGSTLVARSTDGCPGGDEEIWVAKLRLLTGFDGHLRRLKLQSDGYKAVSRCDRIEASGVLTDEYAEFFRYMEQQKFKVYPCAYDWRRSINGERADDLQFMYDLPKRVDECVEKALALYGGTQVDLVTHSMGGLVARHYITSNSDRAKKVNNVISLGTPYWGTLKTFMVLTNGWTYIDRLDPILTNSIVKEIAPNMPSTYQLLPGNTYFQHVGSYFKSVASDGTETVLNTTVKMNDYLSVYNTTLPSAATLLHDGIDNWQVTTPVSYFVFAGTDFATLGYIEYRDRRILGISRPEWVTRFSLDGDGTAPSSSATLMEGRYAGNGTTICKFVHSHGDLPNKLDVLQKLEKALKNQPVGCFVSTPVIRVGEKYSPNSIDVEAGKIYQVTVLGNAVVDVFDEQRRHAGLTSEGLLENNIPLVTYQQGDQQTEIALPPITIYTVTAHISDTQPSQIKIIELIQTGTPEGFITRTVVFSDVPRMSGTVTFIINPLQFTDQAVLHIDTNGDGGSDVTMPPLAVLNHEQGNDKSLPVSQIETQGLKNEVGAFSGEITVTLTATDTGSGVSKILYSLDGGQSNQIYTSPFTVSIKAVSSILAQAFDLAGNVEYPWQERRLLRGTTTYLPLLFR